jgi:hypothetical protein
MFDWIMSIVRRAIFLISCSVGGPQGGILFRGRRQTVALPHDGGSVHYSMWVHTASNPLIARSDNRSQVTLITGVIEQDLSHLTVDIPHFFHHQGTDPFYPDFPHLSLIFKLAQCCCHRRCIRCVTLSVVVAQSHLALIPELLHD